MRRAPLLFCLTMALFVSSCGLSVPELREVWDTEVANQQIPFFIKRKVYCELKDAVYEANNRYEYYDENDTSGKKTVMEYLPKSWGTRLSLTLTIDEKSSFTPGVSLIKPLENSIYRVANARDAISASQSFTLGLGGEASSTATRIEKFDAFYTVAELQKSHPKGSTCLLGPRSVYETGPLTNSSPMIVSELRIKEWLANALFTARTLPSNDSTKAGSGTMPDTFSLELKFVVISSGNVTPSWKLVRVSNNASGTLFSSSRTRTHDLLITIGPQTKDTTDTHLASLIGQSVGAANRALIQP